MTAQPENSRLTEVFLNPGEFHFHTPILGKQQPVRMRTLLGSCVSVILWHPEHHFAGMSHAILPGRSSHNNLTRKDGRYCDEAIALYLQELARCGALPQHFHVYLVGGGRMYLTEKDTMSIGERNIEAARNHLTQAGFIIRAEHVGKDGYRKVELDMTSGVVIVAYNNKHINLTESPRLYKTVIN